MTISFVHGKDCPHRCSMCAGAPVRKVEVHDGEVTIDGEAAGPVDQGWPEKHMRSVRRGGRR